MVKILTPDIIGFPLENMPEWKEYATFHLFRKGQVIFYEEHLPYGIFILTEGTIKADYGHKHETISLPSVLGVLSFSSKIPYTSTVTAVTDCKVYFIGQAAFNLLTTENPAVAGWFSDILSIKELKHNQL